MAVRKWSSRLCAVHRDDPGGVVEAKRRRKNVSAAIDQAECYSVGIQATSDFMVAGGPWGDHKVPFVFAGNGRSYLKQIETDSGI